MLKEFTQQVEYLKNKFFVLSGDDQDTALECMKSVIDELQEHRESFLRRTILEEAEKEVAFAAERMILDRLSGNYEPLFDQTYEIEPPMEFIGDQMSSIHFDTIQYPAPNTLYTEMRDDTIFDNVDNVVEQSRYVCDECGYSANNRKGLYRHGIKENHRTKQQQTNGSHACVLCDFSTSRKFNLDRHMQRVHFPVRNHPCSTCNMYFKDKDTLRQHIKRFHDRNDSSQDPS